MHVAAGDVLTPAELIRNQQNGERVQPPSYYRVPLYDAPNYKTFVQSAMEKSSGSDYNPSESIQVTIDMGKDTSDYNLDKPEGELVLEPASDGSHSVLAENTFKNPVLCRLAQKHLRSLSRSPTTISRPSPSPLENGMSWLF
jgi:hypothetical protein